MIFNIHLFLRLEKKYLFHWILFKKKKKRLTIDSELFHHL